MEIFLKGERIAVHMRGSGNGRHTTIPEHMPSSHRRFGAQRLEAAALRALEIQARNYPSIKSILEKGLDQVPVAQSPEQEPIIHSNIRGSSYYN